MSNLTSPLGRYAAGDGSAAAGDLPTHLVRLIGVPVRILIAAREHHDDVLREFSVLAMSQQDHASQPSRRLAELTELFGSTYGVATNRPDPVVVDAMQRGESTVDLSYEVTADTATAADRLETLMTEADEFCRSEQMLALPRSALLVEIAHWYLDEFRRQIGGEAPRPWSGPSAP